MSVFTSGLLFIRQGSSPKLAWMNKCQPGRLAIWVAVLLIGVLLSVNWLSPMAGTEAQDALPECDPSGDDNDLLYCIWTVEQRFGGFYVDSTNPSVVVQVWLTGDRATEDAERRVLPKSTASGAAISRLQQRMKPITPSAS